jgi:hypothetical protein
MTQEVKSAPASRRAALKAGLAIIAATGAIGIATRAQAQNSKAAPPRWHIKPNPMTVLNAAAVCNS